ncbi:MAG: response regulator [Acidobacteriota bacterium]
MTHGTGQVLLVDDEDGVLNFAKLALERCGDQVLAARTGREAVDTFALQCKTIAVVVLDLTMPGMGGDAVLLEMQRIDPAVRVILSSGYGEDDSSRRFQSYGLAGFLPKPYTARTLADKIRSVLEPA